MGMVFCRGCGKEIHDSAPTCSACGAPKGTAAASGNQRSVGKLIGFGIVWALVFCFGWGLFAGLIGVPMSWNGPMELISIALSAVLTKAGKLPGTKKPNLMPQNVK